MKINLLCKKIRLKLLGIEAKSKKNVITITSWNLPIPLTFQFAIMFGCITFVPFGCLSATSNKRMAWLVSRELKTSTIKDSEVSVLPAKKAGAVQL